MSTIDAATEISATMAIALDTALENGGRLVRHAGGYWAPAGAPRDHNGLPVERFGTTTVAGLVARGRMEFSQWRETRRSEGRRRHPLRFPIEAKVLEESSLCP